MDRGSVKSLVRRYLFELKIFFVILFQVVRKIYSDTMKPLNLYNYILLPVLVLGPIGVLAGSVHEKPEHFFSQLRQIIHGLESKSPVLLQLEADVAESSANVLYARAEKGLKFGLNISNQSIHQDNPDEDYYHHFRTFSQVYLRKPLYHWGALEAQEKIALENEISKHEIFKFRKRSLIGECRSQYLQLILDQYRLGLTQKYIDLAQKNTANIKKKLSLEIDTQLNLDQALSYEISKKIELSEQLVHLETKKAEFASLFGYTENLELEMNESYMSFSLDYNFTSNYPILIATADSSEIRHLRHLIRNEENRKTIANSQLKPKLNLLSTFYQDQIDVVGSQENLQRNNFLIGIEANWAIWDSYQSKAQRQAAIARQEKYEHMLEQRKKVFFIQVNAIADELSSLNDRISLSRKMINIEKRRVAKSKMEYDLGKVNYSTYLSHLLALDTSHISNLGLINKYLRLVDLYDQYVNSVDYIGVNLK